MGEHAYDDKFFDYISIGSRRSAGIVIDLLLKQLPISTVLDVGCGRGAWLKVWQEKGVSNVLGVDGQYVDMQSLDVPHDSFHSADISKPFAIERRFDLVQSLEVAEHISEESSNTFVENLVRHSNLILFSAAPPGQGGEFHVNEQEYGYWRDKFLEHRYLLIDFIRQQLVNESEVEPWYRYNILLFVKAEKVAELPQNLQTYLVEDRERVADYAPISWRFRRSVLRLLPQFLISWIATAKHFVIINTRRFFQ